MNKYKEDFDMVTRLCALDGRERTILNYGIEEGRTKAIDEFAERLKENSIRGAFEYKPDKTRPWCKERKFCRVVGTRKIDEIAEEMRGGAS